VTQREGSLEAGEEDFAGGRLFLEHGHAAVPPVQIS
jgi:hypothetical protein